MLILFALSNATHLIYSDPFLESHLFHLVDFLPTKTNTPCHQTHLFRFAWFDSRLSLYEVTCWIIVGQILNTREN